jgi:RNA polymerase sigma factor (sigma-70 family)
LPTQSSPLIELHRKWKRSPNDRLLEQKCLQQLEHLIFFTLKKIGFYPLDPDSEEFQDLLQEVRLLCWETWQRAESDPECTFIALFTRKINYHLITRLKKLQKMQQGRRAYQAQQAITSKSASSDVSLLWIEQAVAQLNPFDRQLLQWRYEGYTLEEIEQKVPLKKTAIHERLQKIETFFEQTLREEEIPNYA